LAAPADGFLVEGDGLLGRLPGAGELVQASFAVEVLYRGDAAGVAIRAQVPPRRELLQRLAEPLVSADLQVSRHVLRPQMHNEALLRPREGTQHTPVKAGVGDAQVGEWLWFTLTVHRLSGSDYHHYMVTYATDRKDTARERPARSTPQIWRRLARAAPHSHQPIGQSGFALTAAELGLTIRQDSSTAWNAPAGIPLSRDTRASGHCGKALPWKYQLLPLSARIRP